MIATKDLYEMVNSKTRGRTCAWKRFWDFVSVKNKDECWEWNGCTIPNGYGKIQIFKKSYLVHRISWLIHFGYYPEGKLVCHICDNKKCVNPSHLFLGTHKDNYEDSAKKDRNCIGERNGFSKLTKEDVLSIVLLKDEMNKMDISRKFGVSDSAVHDIFAGRTWTWLTGIEKRV